MAGVEMRRDQTLLWQAKCNGNVSELPLRQMTSIQEIENEFLDEEPDEESTFYASETQVPAPRYLDYKNEKDINENLRDYDCDIEISSDHHDPVMGENFIRRRDYVTEDGYVSNNVQAERDSGDEIRRTPSHCEPDKSEQKLTRRKSCPIPSEFDRSAKLSLPKQYSVSMLDNDEREESKEDEKASLNASLQKITNMIRKISRPTLRKDDDSQSQDDDYSSAWLPGTDQIPTANLMDKSLNKDNEFDKYSEITVQTRKATKPKVNELSLRPDRTRPRSVSHIQSPTVPALSPGRERFSFTRSLSSNSSSSSESFFPPSNVTDPCFRCGKQVYSLDKIGPIRRELFHKQCFRCFDCNSVLNLKNYCQNPNDKSDKQIYCKNHQPNQESAHISLDDRSLNVVMNNPKLDKINTNIRGSEEERAKSRNPREFRVRGVATTPKLDIVCGQQYGFSYTNGNGLHDAGLVSPRSQPITSPRELRVEEIEPRRVWTRSAMNAAILDLGSPISGRTTHHFYDYGSRAFNHL